MNNQIFLGTHTNDFKSKYIPLISFKNLEQQKIAEEYIIDEASNFLENILKVKIDDFTQAQIPTSQLITDLDFLSIDPKYFYENIFNDLGERDDEGRLKIKPKWGAIFDEKCTPITTGFVSPTYKGYKPDLKEFDYNNNRYRNYGTIDINGTPVFYYIHFTLQEIIDCIRPPSP